MAVDAFRLLQTTPGNPANSIIPVPEMDVGSYKTSLKAIATNLGIVAALGAAFLAVFGFAVKRRSLLIAPRAASRPRNTIYNPNPSPEESSQNRGNPWFGWIPWTLGLSYQTMLEGIPGTGTREGGIKGKMLTVHLDAIVLLRFHAMATRITAVITFVCIVIVMPLYIFNVCSEHNAASINPEQCNATLYNVTAVTNTSAYQRTTIANVPALLLSNINSPDPSGTRSRMWLVAFFYWFILAYIIHELKREWVEIIAMRRVYYLEKNIWSARQKDHEATFLQGATGDNISAENIEDKDLIHREPWIPHPEQPITVPPISLYSVLVGGLPKRPDQASDGFDKELASDFFSEDNMDWQQSMASAFFDHCVPNQPGFSSSVAAITIIPDARQLAEAWQKWYVAAARLRRLRFIRELIADKRQDEINPEDGEGTKYSGDGEGMSSIKETYEDGEGSLSTNGTDEEPFVGGPIYVNRNSREIFYDREVFGSIRDYDADLRIFDHHGFTPEQTAVHARDFAQSASGCCPRGCHEDKIRQASIEELKEAEEDVIIALKEAKQELEMVRRKVAQIEAPEDNQAVKGSKLDARREISTSTDPGPITHAAPLATGEFERAHSAPNQLEGSQWAEVESIVGKQERMIDASRTASVVRTGAFTRPRFKSLKELFDSTKQWIRKKWNEVIDDHARNSTFAIVTFTSRQAAVAARQSMADGRGAGRWTNISDLPIPPLANAAACDILHCFNCCRPVTLSISQTQKDLRHYCTMVSLGLIYLLSVVPIAVIQSLVSPENLEFLFQQFNPNYTPGSLLSNLSGLLSSSIYSLFTSIWPPVFMALANFGSNATSEALAEYSALKYYWWYMFLFAFAGQAIGNAVLTGLAKFFGPNGVNTDVIVNVSQMVYAVLIEVADAIPSVWALFWLNWTIMRAFFVLPSSYLTQYIPAIFSILRMPCCARMMQGGGPGGPVPYRIYIDSGVVLMCATVLAIQSPLVAPFTFVYFVISQPILRRCTIFIYRPRFDNGGLRWPFLYDMVIAMMILGQAILCVSIILKGVVGPAILMFLSIPVIVISQKRTRSRYARAFQDAALLQTSLLDGWDDNDETSEEKREDFRRFLVDAHKAAYVPVCVSGKDTSDILTAEPAVVIPMESDSGHDISKTPVANTSTEASRAQNMRVSELTTAQFQVQHGAILRRAASGKLAVARNAALSSPTSNKISDGELGLSNRKPSPFAKRHVMLAFKQSQQFTDKDL